MRLRKEDKGTGFGFWWSLFGDHCPRMDNRMKCKKMFNSKPEKEQRLIYADTRDRLKYYDDWQEKTEAGKRKYMRAPIVYLRAEMWDCPVEKPKRCGSVRDTTKETVSPDQEKLGLIRLKDTLIAAGQDASHIERQLERM